MPMNRIVAALAVICVALVGALVYQSLPEAKSAEKPSPAYLRIDKFLSSVQKGDYKAACEVLTWYSASQYVSDEQCAVLLRENFKDSHMQYRVVGDTQGAKKYH